MSEDQGIVPDNTVLQSITSVSKPGHLSSGQGDLGVASKVAKLKQTESIRDNLNVNAFETTAEAQDSELPHELSRDVNATAAHANDEGDEVKEGDTCTPVMQLETVRNAVDAHSENTNDRILNDSSVNVDVTTPQPLSSILKPIESSCEDPISEQSLFADKAQEIPTSPEVQSHPPTCEDAEAAVAEANPTTILEASSTCLAQDAKPDTETSLSIQDELHASVSMGDAALVTDKGEATALELCPAPSPHTEYIDPVDIDDTKPRVADEEALDTTFKAVASTSEGAEASADNSISVVGDAPDPSAPAAVAHEALSEDSASVTNLVEETASATDDVIVAEVTTLAPMEDPAHEAAADKLGCISGEALSPAPATDAVALLAGETELSSAAVKMMVTEDTAPASMESAASEAIESVELVACEAIMPVGEERTSMAVEKTAAASKGFETKEELALETSCDALHAHDCQDTTKDSAEEGAIEPELASKQNANASEAAPDTLASPTEPAVATSSEVAPSDGVPCCQDLAEGPSEAQAEGENAGVSVNEPRAPVADENGIDLPKSTWTASYGVTTLPIDDETHMEERGPVEPPITLETTTAVETTLGLTVSSIGEELEPVLPVDDGNEPVIEGEGPKSSWIPSYSVSIHGSPCIKTSEMAQLDQFAEIVDSKALITSGPVLDLAQYDESPAMGNSTDMPPVDLDDSVLTVDDVEQSPADTTQVIADDAYVVSEQIAIINVVAPPVETVPCIDVEDQPEVQMERPESPWTPSYSVVVVGSPHVEVSEVAELDQSADVVDSEASVTSGHLPDVAPAANSSTNTPQVDGDDSLLFTSEFVEKTTGDTSVPINNQVDAAPERMIVFEPAVPQVALPEHAVAGDGVKQAEQAVSTVLDGEAFTVDVVSVQDMGSPTTTHLDLYNATLDEETVTPRPLSLWMPSYSVDIQENSPIGRSDARPLEQSRATVEMVTELSSSQAQTEHTVPIAEAQNDALMTDASAIDESSSAPAIISEVASLQVESTPPPINEEAVEPRSWTPSYSVNVQGISVTNDVEVWPGEAESHVSVQRPDTDEIAAVEVLKETPLIASLDSNATVHTIEVIDTVVRNSSLIVDITPINPTSQINPDLDSQAATAESSIPQPAPSCSEDPQGTPCIQKTVLEEVSQAGVTGTSDVQPPFLVNEHVDTSKPPSVKPDAQKGVTQILSEELRDLGSESPKASSHSANVRGSPRLLEGDLLPTQPTVITDIIYSEVTNAKAGASHVAVDACIAPHEGIHVPELRAEVVQLDVVTSETSVQTSSWQPSYTVTVQGSPRPAETELEPLKAIDTSGYEEQEFISFPATVGNTVSPQPVQAEDAQNQVTTSDSPGDGDPLATKPDDLSDDIITASLQPQASSLSKSSEHLNAPEPFIEDQPSPYTPPYTVHRQGSGFLDDLPAVEQSPVQATHGMAIEEPADFGQPNKDAAHSEVETKPTIGATDSSEPAAEAKVAPSSSASDLIAQIPITVMQLFPSKGDSSKEAKKPTLTGLTTVDEVDRTRNMSLLTASVSPMTGRTRIESTTSSRFFPGGWFSSTPKQPEGRTSLDVAAGEFTSIQGSESPLATLSPPAPATTPTTSEEKESKKSKCLIM